MSEILDHSTVTTVDRVDSQSPSVTLGEVLAGCCSAVAAGVQSAVRGARAAGRALDAAEARSRERAVYAVDPQLAAALQATTSGREAVAVLQRCKLHLSEPATVEPMIRRLQLALAHAPEHAGTAALARSVYAEACAQHSHIVARSTFVHAVAAAEKIGLRVVKALPERGYLLAAGAGGETFRADVKRNTATGEVNFVQETDGYSGDACRVVHDRFTAALEQAVKLTTPRRTKKPPVRRTHLAAQQNIGQ